MSEIEKTIDILKRLKIATATSNVDDFVTHWMPLPNPPEGERSDVK